MEKKEFLDYLQEEKPIGATDLKKLAEVVKDYPFFQAGRALHLRGLKENESLLYNAALKRTAAYTTDRRILFEYITSESFHQHRTSDGIKKHKNSNPDVQEKDYEEVLNMKTEDANKVLDPSLFNATEKQEKSPEEKLQTGKPLNFNKTETHSFSEWMKLTKAKPIDRRAEKTTATPEKERKLKLIDAFISKNPKISPVKEDYKKGDFSHSKPSENNLMTETLARVYLEQKNYAKAIQAYNILILKNPEKSGFFADQIRSIKHLQENKNP